MNGSTWLEEIQSHYRDHKDQSERAAAQVSDDDFFAKFGGNPVSIAVLMKHIGGNHRSRWRDFLTTDGEKRDRDRENEFTAESETRASVIEKWEEGWAVAFATLASLKPDDIERTITIRGQPMSVMQAVHRNLNHAVYHTGQIVQVARQCVGDEWRSLSIAVGKSQEHNDVMRAKYGDWWADEGGDSEA